MSPAAADSVGVRRLGTGALAGVLVFLLVCTAVQGLRADLDWIAAPLSFYLVDAYGLWVRLAYSALSLSLAAIGIGYYQALSPQARSGAPLLLFVMAAAALATTAWAETNRPWLAPTFEGYVHGIAAQAAFLCTTVAMLLQSWRLRGDAQWRERFAIAFGLALAGFAAMWVHALWREAPRGLGQKVVVVLILLWLGLAAAWLRRSGRAPEASRSPVAEGLAGDG